MEMLMIWNEICRATGLQRQRQKPIWKLASEQRSKWRFLGCRTVLSNTQSSSALNSDGNGKSRADARLDILLEKDGKPLAVMELKRPRIKLTADDGAQGLSYARLVQPPAPIVVVTNGTDVRILETSTGNPWKPATATEDAFKDLITQASRVAGVDIRHAIDTLMGTAPNVWMQAVRLVSTETIEELTASWDEPALPFAADFLTPRAATHGGKATGAARPSSRRQEQCATRTMRSDGAERHPRHPVRRGGRWRWRATNLGRLNLAIAELARIASRGARLAHPHLKSRWRAARPGI